MPPYLQLVYCSSRNITFSCCTTQSGRPASRNDQRSTINDQQQSTTINNNQQQSTTINNNQQQSTTINEHNSTTIFLLPCTPTLRPRTKRANIYLISIFALTRYWKRCFNLLLFAAFPFSSVPSLSSSPHIPISNYPSSRRNVGVKMDLVSLSARCSFLSVAYCGYFLLLRPFAGWKTAKVEPLHRSSTKRISEEYRQGQREGRPTSFLALVLYTQLYRK
jgi:hypothetical protein